MYIYLKNFKKRFYLEKPIRMYVRGKKKEKKKRNKEKLYYVKCKMSFVAHS